MHLLMVGLNHNSAPIEIRERFSFSPTELPEAMKKLAQEKSILENIIVSTCNRTEIYVVVDQIHTGRFYVKSFLSQWFDIEKEDFISYLNIYEGEDVVDHLLKTVCGLNSMVLGETQILGQIRTSFLTAQQEKTIGTVFNYLFKQAVTFAKKAHSETQIGENAVSVSYAAVELAKKIFGNLSTCHVMIFGAGKMGDLALQNLFGQGLGKVTVINRTFSKAEDMAARFNGTARPIEELEKALTEVDILISSTGAKDFVIGEELMHRVEKQRKGKPLFMIDIAVPRDIDPAVGNCKDVFLYDIDDLKDIVDANLEERKKEALKIEAMIGQEIMAFFSWLSMLGVVPVISALRNKALAIQEETLSSIERKMPDLTERERKVLSKHTKSIVNQLLRDPILAVKELSGDSNREEALEFFVKVFNIESLVEQEKKMMTAQYQVTKEEPEGAVNTERAEAPVTL